MKSRIFSSVVVAMLIFMALPAVSPTSVLGASSGPNPGSTFANVSFSGADRTWSNTGNAASSKRQHATVTLQSSSEESYYLQATGFGFGIPAGSLINGIEVAIERH